MTDGPEEIEIASGENSELEAALRHALRPETAPAGFTDRVLAQALAQPTQPGSGKLLSWPGQRLWLTGVIAAALVAGVLEGDVAYRHMREQQRRVIEATRQFQTTERITLHALAQAREQLQRAGVPLELD